MRFSTCFLILLFPFVSFSTNYYVSPAGNNSNNGSINAPWETVQFGIDQLTAGDVLYLREGNYGEKVNVNVSGTAASRIIITNYQTEEAILDGTGLNSQIAMIDLVNQDFVTIEGLTIRNNMMLDAQGIHVAGTCDGIELLGNKIYEINFSTNPNLPATPTRNAQSIIVYGTSGTDPITDLKINGNEIYNCMLGHSEALAVNGNVDGFEVINNYVHDNTNIGIDIIGHEGTAPANDQARNGLIKYNIVHDCVADYATSGGLYVDGGKDLIFENNYSYRNGYGVEIGCENVNKTTSNIILRNNIIYDNVEAGLSLGGYNYPSTGKVIDCKVTGNTFYKNDNSDSYTGELYLTYSENCEISNNIFYTSNLNTFAYVENYQPGLIVDYNTIYNPSGSSEFEVDWNGAFYYGYSNYLNGTNNDANSTYGDPQFVDGNLSSIDLHIQTSSPAVDAGDPSYTIGVGEEDLDGNNRVHNSIIDCGAHEFGSSPIANHCTDGIQNEDETGVDCGGVDCVLCPSCTDGIQNGDETDIDCGGPECLACATCNDGIQNGDETDVDCGGPDCSACVTCNDGIQNGNETDVDCGGPDCAACATCNDGVQNGDETGIDCGGPDCNLCTNDGCDIVNAEDFESGWGIWNDGGSDCLKTLGDAAHANSGEYCVRLRDNTSTSVVTTDNLDMSSYPYASISCSFKTLGFNPGHSIRFEYSTNGGSTWSVSKTWTYAADFLNNQRINDVVDIIATFTSTTQFRFACNAASNGDRIFLDDVIINGCNGSDGADPTCDDGIQNGDETGVDCGGTDCDPCETCDDGIQNGNETGIDCGGPDCDSCAGNSCTEIDAESFESGWGMWVDGGSDCLRTPGDAAHANTGTYCIRLRDNTSSSTLTSASMDLSSYESVIVDLSFKTLGFNEVTQMLWLEFSNDGGSFWYDVNEWSYNDEFVNTNRYNESIEVFGPFSSDTKIRLRCDADNNGDRFFVDDIVISACSNNNNNFDIIIDDVDQSNQVVDPMETRLELSIYPNPSSDILNLNIKSAYEISLISIYSLDGRFISQSIVDVPSIELNVEDLQNGVYLINVSNNLQTQVVKFVKQ